MNKNRNNLLNNENETGDRIIKSRLVSAVIAFGYLLGAYFAADGTNFARRNRAVVQPN